MYKADRPIERASQDILDVKSYAQSLGKAVLSYKESESLSIGLYGAWGSGKTSILNMALEHIEFKTEKYAKEEKPVTVKFDPWNFSDQNQLISQFFEQLSLALSRKEFGKKAQNIGEKLITYSSFFKPFAVIPQITPFALLFSKVFKSFGKAAKTWGDAHLKDLNIVKKEINTLLEKEKRKLIIVIDDIDRLNNTEIRQIFQLVKSLGDFPNTIYLLAFDKNAVVNALGKVQEGDGFEYLEKVIQVPFELPAISKNNVEKYLFSQLNILLKDIPENHFDKTYWGNIYHSGLRHFFNNIRDVNRYINVLQFGFEMVKDEINPVDFFAITGIQVFLPGLYHGIRDNKDFFTGASEDYSLYE